MTLYRGRVRTDDDCASQRFRVVVWPLVDDALRVARMLVHNGADADDLVQETLLAAFKAIDQFSDGTDARAWLLTILRRKRIDQLRRDHARRADVTASLDAVGFDPEASQAVAECPESAWHDPETLLNQFADADLIYAIQSLPEEMRWTLLLTDVEGLDHADVATIVGVPEGTVKSRVHRARAALRKVLLPLARERGWVKRDMTGEESGGCP